MLKQNKDLFGDSVPSALKDNKKRVGYIDADIIAYRACCAAEKEIQFDNIDHDQTLFVNDFNTVKEIFDASILKIMFTFELDYYFLCFSHKDNFRKKKIPFYKSNRTQPKPLHFDRIKAYAKKNYDCIELAGLEGDDVCGIYCTQPMKDEMRIAISIDKDFLTLPCHVGQLSTGRVTKISWLDSFHSLCMQILSGDNIDGYKGVKGIGKAKARKIVDEFLIACTGDTNYCANLFNLLMHEYVKIYGDGEETTNYFWDNVRCAYILRHGDYNFEKHRVKLISHNNFYEMLKEKK